MTGYDISTVGTLPHSNIHGQFEVYQGDILSMGELIARTRNKDIVLHLAGVSGIAESRQSPRKTYLANTMGTVNVLEACRVNKPNAVVVATSNHVYGSQPVQPHNEEASLNDLDTYSVSKICADYIARSYGLSYNMNTAVIRNTNCFGIGDPHNDHIVPGTILSILRGQSPIIRSTGKIRKGYLYVDDVAEAYLDVGEWLSLNPNKCGEVFNVAAEPVSTHSLVSLICKLMDYDRKITTNNQPTPEEHQWLDDSKIREQVGWKPRHTLEEGLIKTIEWFRTQEVNRNENE